ncbi:hypothetical protein [Streptomyces sp. NPDC046805]|uniref:hypothetical protein n=1 Tax=Streptomyces sp. NPDC046805 TaxID=3155134 RepID=UPI0033CF333D
MEWLSLVGTGLGAVLGVGATLAGEHVRWRRTTRDNKLHDRRSMYVDRLVAFRRVHEETDEVVAAIDASYISLREIREVLASGSTVPTPAYQAARQAHRDTTEAARDVLRRDLSSLGT